MVAHLLAMPRVRGSIPTRSRIFHPKITTILRHCDDMTIFPIIVVSGIVANKRRLYASTISNTQMMDVGNFD